MKGWRQRAQDGSSSSSSLSLSNSSLTGTITGERRGKELLPVVKVELLVEDVTVLTEGGRDVATDNDVVDSVEHTAEVGGGGKNAPFGKGRGKTGLGALPTVLPCPGNFISAVETTAIGPALVAAEAACAA